MDEISRAVGARPGFDRPSIPPLRCLSRLYAQTMSAVELLADPVRAQLDRAFLIRVGQR
jgi:hypothetical protein